MLDYLVRIDDLSNATIPKWDSGFILEEYHAVKRKQWKCNCPRGRYKSCKHLAMVKDAEKIKIYNLVTMFWEFVKDFSEE